MTEGEEGRATEWQLSARCHSVPPLSFCPPIVILSEAKNLPSRLRGMARKILRSEAPQNDREEETVPQNDREGKTAPQNDRGGKSRFAGLCFVFLAMYKTSYIMGEYDQHPTYYVMGDTFPECEKAWSKEETSTMPT